MRKFFTSALVALSLAAALAVTALPGAAAAMTFPSLSMLQAYLLETSPSQSMAAGTHYVDLDGTVLSITWAGQSNHYNMLISVDDPKATVPIGADAPQLNVHFRLHKEQPPFQVGDEITVFGSLNEMYSSVVVPDVLAQYINGSDDF